MTREPAAAALLLLASACAGTVPQACREGERAVVSETLYFGASYPGGEVSPAEWSDFLAAVVTPRFPEGFTAWSGAGQWRGSDGRIVREPSHIVSIVHPSADRADADVAEMVAAYKSRFHQESVLRMRSSACAAL